MRSTIHKNQQLKTIFFLLVIVFSAISSKAQVPNIFKWATNYDETFIDILNDDNGIIYLLGGQNNIALGNSLIWRPYVFKMDLQENILDSFILFNFQDSVLLHKLIRKDSFIYAFGVKYYEMGSDNIIVKYDNKFNKISENNYFYDSLISLKGVQDVVQNDSFFYVINYDSYINQGFPRFSILKLNMDLDSIDAFLSYPYTGIAYSGLMNKQNDNFRVFTYLYYGVGWGQSVYFDKNLNIIRIDTLPDLLHQFNDALWISDTSFLVTGITEYTRDSVSMPGKYDWDLGIIVLDTANNQLDYNYQYRLGSEDFPGWGKNIIKDLTNSYYYVGTVNRITHPSDTSTVLLTKLDSNFNIIWEKQITDNLHSFDVVGIFQLLDSTLLLFVWRYENHANWNRDAYAYKISKDGDVLSVTRIATPRAKITLFPNPATTTLNLRLQAPNQNIASLTVYNTLGQQVMALEPKKSEMEVDVRSLQSGVYLVEGFTNKGERFSGKFVKE